MVVRALKESIKMTDLIDKLFDRLVVTDSDCWEFVGGRTGAGYGALWIGDGKCKGTHVISYELHKGPVPVGMKVCHTCDNPPCCNPKHLFLGTTQDNKNDEIAKDRHVYGERVGNHKLTEDDVRAIRVLLEEGFTLSYIGERFNVTKQAIYRIKHGLSWGWLQ